MIAGASIFILVIAIMDQSGHKYWQFPQTRTIRAQSQATAERSLARAWG
jgi:hypothetical protein